MEMPPPDRMYVSMLYRARLLYGDVLASLKTDVFCVSFTVPGLPHLLISDALPGRRMETAHTGEKTFILYVNSFWLVHSSTHYT